MYHKLMRQIIEKVSEHGECAAFDHSSTTNNGIPVYHAYIYLWDNFDNSEELAKWFFDAGAETVRVEWTLYCSENGDKNGMTPEGTRPWTVVFTMKAE